VKRDSAQSENRWLLIRSLFEVAHDFEPPLAYLHARVEGA